MQKKISKTYKKEVDFEREFVNYLIGKGWGVSPRLTCRGGGWPDRQAILNGTTVYFEFKFAKSRSKLNYKQKVRRDMLVDKGAPYFVVHQDNWRNVLGELSGIEIEADTQERIKKWTSPFEV